MHVITAQLPHPSARTCFLGVLIRLLSGLHLITGGWLLLALLMLLLLALLCSRSGSRLFRRRCLFGLSSFSCCRRCCAFLLVLALCVGLLLSFLLILALLALLVLALSLWDRFVRMRKRRL